MGRQIKRGLTNNSSSLSSMDLSTSCLLSSLLLLYMSINPFMQADNRRFLQECSSSEFSSTLDMASATLQLQKDIFFYVVTWFLYVIKMSFCPSVKWQIFWREDASIVHNIFIHAYLSQHLIGQAESWNRETGLAYLSIFSAFSRAAGSWSIRLRSPLLSGDGNNFERTCSFTVVSRDTSVSCNTPQSSFHRAFLKTGVTAETTVGGEQGIQVPPSKCVK